MTDKEKHEVVLKEYTVEELKDGVLGECLNDCNNPYKCTIDCDYGNAVKNAVEVLEEIQRS